MRIIKEKLTKKNIKKHLIDILNFCFSLKIAVFGIPLLIALILFLNWKVSQFSSIINSFLFSSSGNTAGLGNVSAIAVVIWTAAFALVIIYIQILERKQLGIPIVDLIKVRLGSLSWFHFAVTVFALEMGALLIGVSRNSMLFTTLLTFAQIYNLLIFYWNLIIMTTVVHAEEIIDKTGEAFISKFSEASYTEGNFKKDWQQHLLYKLLRGIDLKDLYYSDVAINCIIRFLKQAEKVHNNGQSQEYYVNAVIFYMLRAVYESHLEKDVPQNFVMSLFNELRKSSLDESGVEKGYSVFSSGWRLILWYIVKEQEDYTLAQKLSECSISGLPHMDEEVLTRKTWLVLVVKKSCSNYGGEQFSDILNSSDFSIDECNQRHFYWSTLCRSY